MVVTLIRFTNKEVLVWACRKQETPTPNPRTTSHHYVVVTLIRSIDIWAPKPRTIARRTSGAWMGHFRHFESTSSSENFRPHAGICPCKRSYGAARWAAANDLRGPLGGPLRWFPSLSLREPSSSSEVSLCASGQRAKPSGAPCRPFWRPASLPSASESGHRGPTRKGILIEGFVHQQHVKQPNLGIEVAKERDPN